MSGMKRMIKKLWYSVFSDHPYCLPGRVLVKCLPVSYISQIQDDFFTRMGSSRGLVATMIRAELNRQYFSASEGDIRRLNRERFWGGEAGKRWHQLNRRHDPEFQKEYFRFRTPVVEVLKDLLRPGDQFHSICEVGTGNGLFLHHLSKELSSIKAFVGIDLNKEQIQENQRIYINSPLQFVHAEILDWIDHAVEQGTIFVSCGTFECLTQQELMEVLEAVMAKHRAVVALTEPVNIDLTTDVTSKPRGNTMWSHNYPYWLRRLGYDILFEKVVPIDHSVPFYSTVMVVAETTRQL